MVFGRSQEEQSLINSLKIAEYYKQNFATTPYMLCIEFWGERNSQNIFVKVRIKHNRIGVLN